MKAYVLSTCSTCNRILKEINWIGEVQNIKENSIEESVLDQIAKEHGSYEAIFSKRAMKYKSLGLKEKKLSDLDYKKYILNEYTFLKRPVFLVKGKSFVGNSKKVIEALKKEL